MPAVLLPPLRAIFARATVLGVVLLSAAFVGAAGDLPPEPPPLRLRGLTPDAQAAVRKEHDRARNAWLESLSDEQQKAHLERQRAVRDLRRRPGGQGLPDAAGYAWRDAAQSSGLSTPEIDQLARDHLLIEDRQFKQSFEIYLGNPHPVFITSDSLLNAFHVLLEDALHDLELRRIPLLRQHLETIVAQARANFRENDFPVAKVAGGWRHAQFVVGPALRLLGTAPEFFDADVRDEIESQLAKIRQAEAVELPAWLGPPARSLLAIDYRRCRPVGFYSEAPPLADYFRAVRWLQMVPFRADRDGELTAIGLLGFGLSRAYQTNAEGFFRRFGALLGSSDERDLVDAAFEFQNFLGNPHGKDSWESTMLSARRWLLRDRIPAEDFRRLRDELRLPPDAPTILSEFQFRVLPSYRLREAVLFQQLADAGATPGGLAFAAMLGSSFARRHLAIDAAMFDAAVAATIPTQEQRGISRHERSLYDDYLDALATLVGPPEPDAPELLRSEAWAAKSCQTALAGWAQMRHTFTLQTKLAITYFGLVETPPGFVEPSPAFFGRLANVIERASTLLDADDAFTPSTSAVSTRLRSTADFLESLGFHRESAEPDARETLSGPDRSRYVSATFGLGATRALPDWDRELSSNPTAAQFQSFHRDLIAAYRLEAERLERGDRLLNPREHGTRDRWVKLERVARRLEALAQKQLRQQPWSRDEALFIKNYGEELAGVMGYSGSSWLTPRDDAPRWAELFRDSQADESVAAGIGRARLLHVLYPWKGVTYLCQGAVLSYYETTSRVRLTDAEWRTHLDSPEAPPPPAWLRPYLAR